MERTGSCPGHRGEKGRRLIDDRIGDNHNHIERMRIMPNQFAVAGNRIDIKNPHQVHGAIELLLAVGLTGALLIFLPGGREATARAMGMLRHLDSMEPEQVSLLLFTAGFWVLAFLCGMAAVKHLYKGFRNILSFYVPPNMPKSLTSPESINSLLEHRIISEFENPPSTLLRAARLISTRLRFLTKTPAAFVENTLNAIKYWLLVLPLLAVPAFALGFFQHYIPFRLEYSLPWALFLVVAVTLGVRVATLFLLTSFTPEADVFERRSHVVEAGNPSSFFGFVRERLEPMRVEQFRNRIYLDQEPHVHNVKESDTNKYEGMIQVETQPLPLPHKASNAAIFLGFGGGAVKFMGYIVLFMTFASGSSGFLDMSRNGLDLIFTLLAGIMAIKVGSYFLRTARVISYRFLFKSNLISLQMKGTYTASKIGYGDGRFSQLYSNRVSIQSDSHLVVTGAQIISESTGLDEPWATRVIISASTPPEYLNLVDGFIKSLHEYKDTASSLASINTQDESFLKIANANASLTMHQAAAREAGKASIAQGRGAGIKEIGGEEAVWELHAGRDAKQLPNGGGESEDLPGAGADRIECPECAEYVKKNARKCRFCGYILRAQ